MLSTIVHAQIHRHLRSNSKHFLAITRLSLSRLASSQISPVEGRSELAPPHAVADCDAALAASCSYKTSAVEVNRMERLRVVEAGGFCVRV